MFRHPSNYCSYSPYYHHKPQFIRVGDFDEARIGTKARPKTDEPEFNYDQLFEEFDDEALEAANSATLYESCKDLTRILKLPGLVQNLEDSAKDAWGFTGPSNEEMRRLLRNHSARVARARLQCRPVERGVCVGYWKHSTPPFRHAVHATQAQGGKIGLRIAETNEQGIYQAPVPLGIDLPLLWADVILAKRFDFTNPVFRNDAIKEAIHQEVPSY